MTGLAPQGGYAGTAQRQARSLSPPSGGGGYVAFGSMPSYRPPQPRGMPMQSFAPPGGQSSAIPSQPPPGTPNYGGISGLDQYGQPILDTLGRRPWWAQLTQHWQGQSQGGPAGPPQHDPYGYRVN